MLLVYKLVVVRNSRLTFYGFYFSQILKSDVQFVLFEMICRRKNLVHIFDWSITGVKYC